MRHARTRRRTAHGLTVAALLGSSAFLAPTASAATNTDGLWYFTDTGIAEAQQIANGAGVEIALIDSQINPGVPDLNGTTLTVHEPSYCAAREGGEPLPAVEDSAEARHTTSMASLLLGSGAGFPGDPGVVGVAPGAHVTVYAQLYQDGCAGSVPETGGSTQAFKDAVAAGPDIIVVPGSTTTTPDVTDAIRSGIVVIGAGGNDGNEVWGSPAASNGVIATGQVASDGSVAAISARGPQLGLLAPATTVRSIDPTFSFYGTTDGSSNSSVITAGVIALAMSAHPDATSSQILQAVVRTTDGSVHEPARDETRGYGALDVRQLMTIDPTTLPDVNPFIRTDADAFPTAEDLGVSTGTETEAPPTHTATAPPADADPDAPGQSEDGANTLIIGGLTVGAIAVAAVVVPLLLRRRNASDSDHRGQPQAGQPHG